MTDLVTLTGYVATPPKHVVTSGGLPITSFRLVSRQRRFDRQQQKWVDADANWYTVTAFRRLAVGVHRSVEKGQHVVVAGRVRVRDWESGERSGTTVEIEADALGHDLAWGTASWTRTPAADRTGEGDAPSSSEHGQLPPSAEEADASPDAAWEPDSTALPF